MVVQRITSCSKKKKKEIWIFFFKKKKKKKREISFQKKKNHSFFKNLVLLNYVLTWSSMTEVRRQPCRGPVPITQITLENKFKKYDKIVWVHVRLNSFVLHQACSNLGHWPIYIVCKYVLLAWKHGFIWGSRMKAWFHLRHQSIFFASMSTLMVMAKNVFMITSF